MPNPLTSYFGVSAVAMPLRDQRMKLIASNLANADTPNYKAKDIAFDDVLRQAAGAAAPLQTTDARHMNGLNLQPQTFERTPLQPSLDGNTVDLDIERAAYGPRRAGVPRLAELRRIQDPHADDGDHRRVSHEQPAHLRRGRSGPAGAVGPAQHHRQQLIQRQIDRLVPGRGLQADRTRCSRRCRPPATAR